METDFQAGFLDHACRVLDLTDENGYLCGKILADLGADVIKVEKPGGDPGRWRGPFYHDVPHPEKSLYWFAFNVNKRSITLDIETGDGAALFRRLVKNADVVIESFQPSHMDSLGLGYSALSAINPRLVVTSISPFGQEGLRKDWKGSDIVWMAMGGFMGQAGDADMPPIRISLDQASLHAGSEAAVASLMALYQCANGGQGQHIDVSIEASVVVASISAVPFWTLNNVILKRSGPFRVGLRKGGGQLRQQWQCKNGFVTFAVLGGMAGAQSNGALVRWMESEGLATETLKKMEWSKFDLSTADNALMSGLEEAVARFFLLHTKEELYEEAIKRRIMLYPVCSIGDVLDDRQLKSRGFWANVAHDELRDSITYPGAFAKSSEVEMTVRRRPPLIGESNIEIYEGELGLSRRELSALAEVKVI